MARTRLLPGIICVSVAMLAGCSEPEPAAPVVKAPVHLLAGQWTITHRMTGYNYPGVTAEEYAAQVGQQEKADLCLKVDTDGLPDAAALAGPQGKDCRTVSASASKGRLSATLACTGDVSIILEGNYRADSLSLGSRVTRPRNTGGALRTTTDVSGTRTGDCRSE